MKTTFIYILIDPRNNHVRYIGKTDNPRKRFNDHLNDGYSNYNTHKVNWIKSLYKLGLKPIFEILDEVKETEWEFWEMHYISLYKSWGYKLTNGTFGGDGGPSGSLHYLYGKYGKDSPVYGRTHTEETKLKMRLYQLSDKSSMRGKKHTQKALLKIGEASKGINNPNYGGAFHTKEYLDKQIESNSKKPLKVTDTLTNETNVFKNSKEVSLFLNCSPSNIRGTKPKIILKRYLLEFV